MIDVIQRFRLRVLLAVFLLCSAGLGGWWGFRYLPELHRVESVERERDAVRSRNREVEALMIRLGTRAIQDSILRLRREASVLELRVPVEDLSSAAASSMLEAINASGRTFGVQIRAHQWLPGAAEGPFRVEGIRFQAVGRYHDMGAFLADILSLQRLTQLREVRLTVIPDSLLKFSVVEESGGGSGPGTGSGAVLGSLGPEPELMGVLPLPQGERPFDVVGVFTLVWFSQSRTAGAPAAQKEESR